MRLVGTWMALVLMAESASAPLMNLHHFLWHAVQFYLTGEVVR